MTTAPSRLSDKGWKVLATRNLLKDRSRLGQVTSGWSQGVPSRKRRSNFNIPIDHSDLPKLYQTGCQNLPANCLERPVELTEAESPLSLQQKQYLRSPALLKNAPEDRLIEPVAASSGGWHESMICLPLPSQDPKYSDSSAGRDCCVCRQSRALASQH